MSVCGHPDEESVSEEAPLPRDEYAKSSSTAVRVLTVLAYLLSVSMAAILLSFYYICVWKSPELPPLNETELGPSARRDPGPALGRPALDRLPHQYHHTQAGGSNISMNDSASLEPFENATSTEDAPSEQPPSIEPGPGADYDVNRTSPAPPDTPPAPPDTPGRAT